MGELIVKEPATVSDDTEDELAGKADLVGGKVPVSQLPPASASAAGTLAAADYELMKLGAKATVALTTIATPYAGTETLVGVPGMATKTVTEMGGASGIAAYVTANSTCTATLVGTALTITADAYGDDLNGSSITGTLLAVAGTMAGGLPPQVSNPSPSLDKSVGALGGAGGVSANRIVYVSAGAVLHARANAMATARKVLGVTSAAIAAGEYGSVQRFGYVRVKADSTCAPVLAGEAFLSAESGGLVASALAYVDGNEGQAFPVHLGEFAEGVVGSDGLVGVWLAIDEARDDAREWLLNEWTPTSDAERRNLYLTPGNWDEITMRLENIGKAGVTDNTYLLIDDSLRSQPWIWLTWGAVGSATSNLSFGGVGANFLRWGSITFKNRGDKWEVYNCGGADACVTGTAMIVAPTIALGVVNDTGTGFAANVAKITFTGIRKKA